MARAFNANPVLRPGWKRWGHALGFSYERGTLRADMGPHNERGRAHVWRAEIWRDGDRETVLWQGGDDSYWDLADEVMERTEELLTGGGA